MKDEWVMEEMWYHLVNVTRATPAAGKNNKRYIKHFLMCIINKRLLNELFITFKYNLKQC